MTNPAMIAAVVLALSTIDDALYHNTAGGRGCPKMTPEEFAANRAEIRRREAAYAAQRKAENDAIAKPYRDARRARKAAQLAREKRS